MAYVLAEDLDELYGTAFRKPLERFDEIESHLAHAVYVVVVGLVAASGQSSAVAAPQVNATVSSAADLTAPHPVAAAAVDDDGVVAHQANGAAGNGHAGASTRSRDRESRWETVGGQGVEKRDARYGDGLNLTIASEVTEFRGRGIFRADQAAVMLTWTQQ
ncbi:MAG: hypothetical protein VX911_11055 [Candidatus Latescibacterota bacterium]|nr:hypothetical protein [Candidatus Latescibacterota bacterium]